MGLFFNHKKEETRAAEVSVNDDDLFKLLISPDALTAEKALNIPAVASCVEFVSGLIATLPIKLYKESETENETDEIKDDIRVKLLNDETGDLLDAYQMKKALIRDYLLGGCGYIFINRRRNNVVSLHYVESRNVSVSVGADPIFKNAMLLVNSGVYYPFEFIILTRNTKDGVTGSGILKENREMLTVLYNMVVFERELMKKGGSKKGFLESERRLDKESMKELRRAWDELYSKNGGGVMILNDGIKFVEASNSSVEMQLDENKRTNDALVCGLFGLSPKVVRGEATDEESCGAVKTAILPAVTALQTAINKALLLEDEKGSYYFAVDTAELMKGDILKRYQAYQIALDSNFIQPDEVRYKEDLKPLGLNFIKLGLNDVLFDPRTNTIYTPNTNKTAKMDGKALTEGGESDILKEERAHWTKDDKGRFTGSVSDGGGGGVRLPDIDIGKSLSAKAQNYDVLDLQTGEIYHFVEGTKIQDVEVFAGKGTKNPYRKGADYANKYGGKADDWQHVKGKGTLSTQDGDRKAEVHWSQCKEIGKVEFFVKGWLD